MTEIEIFRPGTHTAMDGRTLAFSAADLAAAARAYDPARHEAPLVIGHPSTDAPAYGWVRALAVRDGRLCAEPHQVNAAFARLVHDGAYKKVSACFFLPGVASNPVPGTYYLRHVGFLGAAPPAVTGLRPVAFASDDGDTVSVEFAATPPEEQTLTTPDPAAALAAREAELRQREQQFQQQQAAFAMREREAARRDDAAFLDGLVREGRPLPLARAEVLAFIASLYDREAVAFAAGQPETPVAWFRRLLSALPQQVTYGELAPGGDDDGDGAAFAAPAGYAVDADGLALHAQALAWQRAHPGTDYDAAVDAVVAQRRG